MNQDMVFWSVIFTVVGSVVVLFGLLIVIARQANTSAKENAILARQADKSAKVSAKDNAK